MNFLPQEIVNEVLKIRNRSLAVFGYSQYKDLPLHKYSGYIRFHIPNSMLDQIIRGEDVTSTS